MDIWKLQIMSSLNRITIVAELSANHLGEINIAKNTIREAFLAGADAVKIQTYTPDTITIKCGNPLFIVQGDTQWDGRSLYDLYNEAQTPWEWQSELKEYAHSLGLLFFSSPFDNTAVDFLENLNVPYYKIASFEITDIPLIKYAASKGKPMIISTGIASLEEIYDAVNACREVGNEDITLLKCTSQYPAKIEDANLLTIPDLRSRFKVKVGLSDHTLGDIVALSSVPLGVTMIEKHFILDRNMGGPDSSFSMEPDEFRLMVQRIREVESAIGRIDYEMSEKKLKSRQFARSLFVVNDILEGEVFTNQNIRSIRPGFGLPPKFYDEVLGKKAKKSLKRGTPLEWNHIELD
jgi:pseudaminic acid synthase